MFFTLEKHFRTEWQLMSPFLRWHTFIHTSTGTHWLYDTNITDWYYSFDKRYVLGMNFFTKFCIRNNRTRRVFLCFIQKMLASTISTRRACWKSRFIWLPLYKVVYAFENIYSVLFGLHSSWTTPATYIHDYVPKTKLNE